MSSSLGTVRKNNPLPTGAIIAGIGFVISGIASYGFLSIASHHLAPAQYSPIATFWALLWILAPGFFYPLEQEIARATSARKAHHIGVRPLVKKAATIATVLVILLLILIACSAHFLASTLFNGHISLVWALGIAMIAYAMEFTVRGLLAGNGLFRRYSLLVSLEGILRLVPCIFIVIIGIGTVGVFGLILGSAALIATLLAPIGSHNLLEHGPPAPFKEVSNALGFLLIASFCNQFLTYAGAVVIRILALPSQHAIAGVFLNALVIARIPLFLFQAIQASMLPQLSHLLGKHEFTAYKKLFSRLFALVIVLGILGTVGFFLLGPWVISVFFGHRYGTMSHTQVGLLALASALLMVGLTLSQSLLSLGRYGYAALTWSSGAIAFLVATILTSGFSLIYRVEFSLIVGSVITVLVGSASYFPQLSKLEKRAAVLLAQHSSVAEVITEKS